MMHSRMAARRVAKASAAALCGAAANYSLLLLCRIGVGVGEAAFEREWRCGQALSVDAAVALALEVCERGGSCVS